MGHIDVHGYALFADLYLPPDDVPVIDRYEWQESQHPRWPAGSASGTGGEFRGRSGGSAPSIHGPNHLNATLESRYIDYRKDFRPRGEHAAIDAENETRAKEAAVYNYPPHKPTTRLRELADRPDILEGHPLHWKSAGEWGRAAFHWHLELSNALREIGASATASTASDPAEKERLYEQVWQSADKTKIRDLLDKMNEMDKQARAAGVNLAEVVNANGLIPRHLGERLLSGSRFFDPERLRGRLREINKQNPDLAAQQREKADASRKQLEQRFFTPHERGQVPAPTEPPKEDPKPPATVDEVIKSAFDALSKQHRTKVDEAIRGAIADGDLPEDQHEDMRAAVMAAWKEMSDEVNDRNNAIRQVMTNFNANWGTVSARLAKGMDYDKIKGFDQMAEYAAAHYPQLLGHSRGESDSGSNEEAFAKTLREGIHPQPNPWDREVIDRISAQVMAAINRPPIEIDESVPFSVHSLPVEIMRYQLEQELIEKFCS